MKRCRRAVELSLLAAACAACSLEARANGVRAGASIVATACTAVLLAAVLVLYLRGLGALWRSAGAGRGIVPARAWMFIAGCAALAVTLFGPLDASAARLFSVHMIQHELLVLVVAPLLVLGAPLATWSWSLPEAWRGRAARSSRALARSRAWQTITRPFWAWLIHGAAIWAWHVPALFTAALGHALMHDLQHATLLATALLFWWSLLRESGARRSAGRAILLLFGTMVHTAALGALLTFSTTRWYPWEPDARGPLGLSALEDQQLAGLVMWIPGGAVYMVAALTLLARWLRAVDKPAPRA